MLIETLICRKSFFNQKFRDFFSNFEPWNTPHAQSEPGLRSNFVQNIRKLQKLLEKNNTQPRNLINTLRLNCSEWHHELKCCKTAMHSKSDENKNWARKR